MPGLGEFELIARYFTRAPKHEAGVEIGIGDDAALVNGSGRIAVAVDTLVESVHFPAGHAARSVGHRALAVNLSDIAAMGLAPRWFTLALTIPEADESWLAAFAEGLFALADRHDVALVGGDTTRGPLTVTVQVMADAGPGPVLTRAGAAPGDAIYVTGTLGDAAAVWSGAADPAPEALRSRFDFPTPRVAAGVALRSLATAAIDVSDGLLADLGHVCRASGCGARVDVATLPLSAALVDCVGLAESRRLALTGGDDYELCFAAPAADERLADAGRASATRFTRIGEFVAAPGIVLTEAGRTFESPGTGFRHF